MVNLIAKKAKEKGRKHWNLAPNLELYAVWLALKCPTKLQLFDNKGLILA